MTRKRTNTLSQRDGRKAFDILNNSLP